MTDTDISLEAVTTWTPDINWLGHDHGTPHMRPANGGMWVSVPDYNTLSAALTQSRAETAAAYERASQWHVTEALNAMNALHCGSENSEYRAAGRLNDFHASAATSLRALATPDQSSALAAIEAAAEARGMRKAADVKGWENFLVDPAPLYLSHWQRGLVAGQKAMRDAILAAIPQGDAPND